ncbi:MAG: hypothetical protein JNK14_13915 [Chitinophagaceae bacterium]|nr:hypothetical protein [Chitinophagaceae bacterium]
MYTKIMRRWVLTACLFTVTYTLTAQDNYNPKFENSHVYAGIEVGSKGVKMSLLETGKDSRTTGAFNILKDTTVNTDFISFTPATFQATVEVFCGLFNAALTKYSIPSTKIFTVVSSGVKMQAEKEEKTQWVSKLVDSFRYKINEPNRQVEVVDVLQEARLSHLGIVPASKRFATFLIDIGSGNTKGGYFPSDDNTKDFKLFQFNWGTKSAANAAEKRMDEYDKTLSTYSKQLYRVLLGAENSELIYAVNSSGAYNLNDYIAFSGGIAWATATLLRPEQAKSSVVTVSYEDVLQLSERLFSDYASLSDAALIQNINDESVDKNAVTKEIKRVHSVFDQRSLMAGTGLLLKVMRQFKSVYESKGFFLVKNGAVGWVSAYVDQSLENEKIASAKQ